MKVFKLSKGWIIHETKYYKRFIIKKGDKSNRIDVRRLGIDKYPKMEDTHLFNTISYLKRNRSLYIRGEKELKVNNQSVDFDTMLDIYQSEYKRRKGFVINLSDFADSLENLIDYDHVKSQLK